MPTVLLKIINKLLSTFGLSIVRKSSLQKQDQLSINDEKALTSMFQLISNNQSRQQEKIDQLSEIVTQLHIKLDNHRKENLSNQIAVKWEVVDFLKRYFPDEETSPLTCPLCGHIASNIAFKVYHSQCAFGGGKLTRHQCPECEVVFGDQKMLALSSEELSQDYEVHYRIYEEADSTDHEIKAFHMLDPKKEGVYLNYGAGAWSRSVQSLRSEGWNVYAYEPHDSAGANVEYLIKNKVQLSEMKFDGIFSNNVLEHFRYPIEDFSFMRTLLKPNGLMAHATPCYEYLYEFTRFHLYFFLGRSREVLAEKSNLKVVDFKVDGEFKCAVYKEK